MNDRPLLAIRDLSVRFYTDEGIVTAVNGVSFDIPEKSTVALVGESGCGKSVTAHSILRLLPTPPAEITGGSIHFGGSDLLKLSPREMRSVRGARISIVFQDATAALNPVYTIGSQVMEALRIHGRAGRRQARSKSIELLERVGFPEAARRFDDYPHELSGGMRQRVMIAIALACEPELMIADEPTTALDMLAAAQIGALLGELKHERNMSLLFISHDIGQVAERADYVVVLYAGQVVERGPAASLLAGPRHPYTRALVASIPPLRKRRRRRRITPTRLPALPGRPPVLEDLVAPPAGCAFVARCPLAFERCHGEEPVLSEVEPGWWARCFLAGEEAVLPLTRSVAHDANGERPPAADEELREEEELETALSQDLTESGKRGAEDEDPDAQEGDES